MNLLDAPVILDQPNPVARGIAGAGSMIAAALIRARDARDARAERERVDAERRMLRSQDLQLRADERAQDLRLRADERAQDLDWRRGEVARRDRQQRLADIEAGRAAPATPSPEEMQRAEFGAGQRQAAAAEIRRKQASDLFARLNDEAARHGRSFGEVRDDAGNVVGYDAAAAARAYGDFWTEQRKTLPADLRSLIDEIGTAEARKVPGVGATLGGSDPGLTARPPVPAPVRQGSQPRTRFQIVKDDLTNTSYRVNLETGEAEPLRFNAAPAAPSAGDVGDPAALDAGEPVGLLSAPAPEAPAPTAAGQPLDPTMLRARASELAGRWVADQGVTVEGAPGGWRTLRPEVAMPTQLPNTAAGTAEGVAQMLARRQMAARAREQDALPQTVQQVQATGQTPALVAGYAAKHGITTAAAEAALRQLGVLR